jgi:N-acetylglucosamine kinase-like BadF-type ATPase
MGLLLGVDSGNSKTIALLARPDGTVVAWARGLPGDIYGGEERARGRVLGTVQEALDAAGAGPEEVAGACFSLCGADWPEDHDYWRQALAEFGLSRATVFNDALGCLRGGSHGGTGVVVAVGTGAAVGARSSDGRTWTSGWWQEPQGGQQLGERALLAVYAAHLGTGPATSLTRRALDHYGAPDVPALLHARTRRGHGPVPPAKDLARAVLDEAAAGDGVALQIVREHARGLAAMAVVAAREVGLTGQAFPLVLTGGVLSHQSELFRQEIAAGVLQREALAQAVRPFAEPAVGALLLAFDAQALPAGHEVLERINRTGPPATFYET